MAWRSARFWGALATFCVAALAGLGCDEDEAAPTPSSDVADSGGADSEAFDSTEGFEVRGSGEGQAVVVRLESGNNLEGELVATYDTNYWDDASEEGFYFALASPGAYDRWWEDDRSVRVVPSSQVSEIQGTEWPDGRPVFRDHLRQHGIVAAQLPLAGMQHVITASDSYHREENGYGDFAVDLVVTDQDGVRFQNDGLENSDYLIWGQEVYLPTGGYIVEVQRDAPDNTPGTYPDEAVNNMVGIRIAGAYYLYLLHFQEGSIPDELVPGDQFYPAGTYIGRVGNSGVSLEPHLHLALLYYDREHARSWSVPFEFANAIVHQAPLDPGAPHDFVRAQSRIWLSQPETTP
ncbi:MAG: hypothetical protein KC561_00740 [Myxococcales bacterium]|nr:hypothetical protein [Myxococcales bacterium]